jgi:hypothetical protein
MVHKNTLRLLVSGYYEKCKTNLLLLLGTGSNIHILWFSVSGLI